MSRRCIAVDTESQGYARLDFFQMQLQSIYQIDVPLAVSDFVTTNSRIASWLTNGDKDHLREKLLVWQEGEDLGLSLYLHPDIMKTLMEQTAEDQLGPEHLENLCLAIEGISHFLYLTWRAIQLHQVSLLELELQAEVDKYIVLLSLAKKHKKFELLERLRQVLFEDIGFDSALDAVELSRYREANRYAARYCRLLESRYPHDAGNKRLASELRQFYRLGQNAKFRKIDNFI